MISQHLFRWWLVADKQKAITRSSDLDMWTQMSSFSSSPEFWKPNNNSTRSSGSVWPPCNDNVVIDDHYSEGSVWNYPGLIQYEDAVLSAQEILLWR